LLFLPHLQLFSPPKSWNRDSKSSTEIGIKFFQTLMTADIFFYLLPWTMDVLNTIWSGESFLEGSPFIWPISSREITVYDGYTLIKYIS
jgi:hypothetical protein